MNEKLTALWQQIEPRLRIIMIACLLAMLIVILYLKSVGSGAAMDSPPPVSPPQIDLTEEQTKQIQIVGQDPKGVPEPIAQTIYSPLIAHSMFDVKSVLDAAQQAASVDRLYIQAQQLANSRPPKYLEAQQIIKQILTIKSDHLKARQMMEDIQAKLKYLNVGNNGPE